MLLQCGVDGGVGEEARAAAWLGAATLDSLTELNELGLALLAEQVALPGAPPAAALREAGGAWRSLDAAARRRAASCPYLLLDAGFAERERWRCAAGDALRGDGAAFFTVPGALDALRLVLTFAWHLARTQPAAARPLLGMPAMSATALGALTLRQVHGLAERHPGWLRLRWASRPQFWRELLRAAGAGEARALERARLYGLTMLAAEARTESGAARAPLPGPRAAPAPCLISPAGTASTVPSPRSPARP